MQSDLKKTHGLSGRRGSALIAVIAAIAIFSVLATALLSMTSTSGRQIAQSHLADQAYLMAESGYRYVTSQYQHPPVATPDPNDVLENLDGASTTLDRNDGRFDLEIFSYFYEITANAAVDAPMVSVRTPGSYPNTEIPSLVGQKVYIQGDIYSLAEGSGLIAESEDQLNFIITPGLHEPVEAKTIVHPLTDAGTWNNDNRTISFTSGLANMFPNQNGRIRVAGRTLTYRLKNETDYVFTDVKDLHGADMTGFNIPSPAQILLLPYIQVNATGRIGEDDTLTRRKVSFYGALGTEFSEVYAEAFDDEDIILATPKGIGTHEIDTAEDALKVTGLDTDGLYLSQLDVEADDTAIAAKEAFNDFRRSSGGYLSYDAQAKVGFYPDGGKDPDVFFQNKDMAAGLSFRLNSDSIGEETKYNMYGLSFLHKEEAPPIPGYILDDITPDRMPPDEPAIVLWQQTIGAEGTENRTWIAYKNLKTQFYDDFDDGIDSEIWTIEDGNWAPIDQALFITDSVDYEGRISFSKILPDCECSDYYLRFNSVGSDWASRQVKIFEGADEIGGKAFSSEPHESIESFIIPKDYLGTKITIQFYIKNENGSGSWKIDDVRIVNKSANPIHNSTLLVRLKEAAVVPFNYEETATAIIETGDRVVGVDSGTWGRVIAPPLITTTESPQGYVLLNSLPATSWFNMSDESLNVLGKGTIAAVHGAPVEDTYRKANIIKVYYASESGCTALVPDPSIPTDCYTKDYRQVGLNESLKWPVQEGAEWTAAKDYFRLIQWDDVNPSVTMDTDIDRTVIFSHHEKLQSPNIGEALSAPELGLHAIGSDAANHVYFDDFGFQLFYLQDALFPSALQQ